MSTHENGYKIPIPDSNCPLARMWAKRTAKMWPTLGSE